LLLMQSGVNVSSIESTSAKSTTWPIWPQERIAATSELLNVLFAILGPMSVGFILGVLAKALRPKPHRDPRVTV